jgi:signal transduction histidine kinase
METWTSTIQSNGGKIAKEIVKIRETAKEQIERLRACLDALRPESEAI